MRATTTCERLVERDAQALVGEHPAELTLRRLGRVLGDDAERAGERMARPHRRGDDLQVVGQLVAEQQPLLANAARDQRPGAHGNAESQQAEQRAADHGQCQQQDERAGHDPRGELRRRYGDAGDVEPVPEPYSPRRRVERARRAQRRRDASGPPCIAGARLGWWVDVRGHAGSRREAPRPHEQPQRAADEQRGDHGWREPPADGRSPERRAVRAVERLVGGGSSAGDVVDGARRSGEARDADVDHDALVRAARRSGSGADTGWRGGSRAGRRCA